MLQKIENFALNIYFYTKKHFRDIVIAFLVLMILFLLGDKLGWNKLITGKANDLLVYLNMRKTIAVETILAIASTISAIFAVIISIRANRISKIALEVERPVLEFSCETFDEDKKEQKIKIKNIGKSDAANIQFLIKSEEGFKRLHTSISKLSYGVSPIEINIKPESYATTFVVKYQNTLTGKIYEQSGETRKQSNQVHQVSEL